MKRSYLEEMMQVDGQGAAPGLERLRENYHSYVELHQVIKKEKPSFEFTYTELVEQITDNKGLQDTVWTQNHKSVQSVTRQQVNTKLGHEVLDHLR